MVGMNYRSWAIVFLSIISMSIQAGLCCSKSDEQSYGERVPLLKQQQNHTEVPIAISDNQLEKLAVLEHALFAGRDDATLKKYIDDNRDLIRMVVGGYTALTYAVMTGRTDLVDYLVENKVTIAHIDNVGNSYLHEATRYAHPRVMQKLLDRGIKIDSQNKRGQTALHLAVRGYCVDTVKLLLEAKAKLDIKDIQKESPLQTAQRKKKNEYIALLEDAAKKQVMIE